MLDLCCNTGGFAVYAKALGGAAEVIGLDLDEQALDLAKQNAKLNGAQIRFVQADLFPWLRDVIPNGERFDVVVLDPAKLTRDREDGRSGAEEVLRHEPAGAAGGGARRRVPDLLLHGPGERGGLPRIAPPGRVAGGAARCRSSRSAGPAPTTRSCCTCRRGAT